MEREIMATGIGGQGVQIAAQTLARAATIEDKFVSYMGIYGGMMRGGNSDCYVVVADQPIEAPPLLSRTWSALVMHHEFWLPLRTKLRDGSVVVVNSTLFEGDLDRQAWHVIDVPATALAVEIGNVMCASMILTGAYVAATGMVSLDATIEAMRESIPSYRQQHLAMNEAALRKGFEVTDKLTAPAWAPESAATKVGAGA